MTEQQGVWYQAMVNGKRVWHFYPTPVPGSYPVESKPQWEFGYSGTKDQPKIVWRTTKEVPPPPPPSPSPGTVTVYGKTAVILHSQEQPQMLVPASHATAGYHNYCTYNYHNTYNMIGPAEQAAAAAAAAAVEEAAKAEEKEKEKAEAEEKAKAEAEAIYISEDDVKLDAMLHEQAQALRQLYYLHTVDYGAGDPYGRRYFAS